MQQASGPTTLGLPTNLHRRPDLAVSESRTGDRGSAAPRAAKRSVRDHDDQRQRKPVHNELAKNSAIRSRSLRCRQHPSGCARREHSPSPPTPARSGWSTEILDRALEGRLPMLPPFPATALTSSGLPGSDLIDTHSCGAAYSACRNACSESYGSFLPSTSESARMIASVLSASPGGTPRGFAICTRPSVLT